MKQLRLAGLLATLFGTANVHAAAPPISDDCSQTKELNRAIVACTEEIQVVGGTAPLFVTRGWAYFLKFDYERAFADFDAAIRSDSKDALAYRYRGIVFQIKGDDDRAIADFTKALELGLKDPRTFVDRGGAYASKGATAQALADYGTAIQQDPSSPYAYLMRGIVRTYDGALEDAQADFKRGFEAAPFPHFMIWLHIAERRANKPSTLAAAIPKLDMTKWPAQAVRMFLGEEKPEAVLARGVANAKVRDYGACESDFFVAEFMYLQKHSEEAVRLYKAAQQSCRRNFVEWLAATSALRSLDAAK